MRGGERDIGGESNRVVRRRLDAESGGRGERDTRCGCHVDRVGSSRTETESVLLKLKGDFPVGACHNTPLVWLCCPLDRIVSPN